MSEKITDRVDDSLLKFSVGMAEHITNFMEAINIIKLGKVKRVDFNSSTTIYRAGDVARIDIKAPLNKSGVVVEEDAIRIPETVTDQQVQEAMRLGSEVTNFIEAIEMVKAGKVRRIDLNEKTIIYRVEDIVRIDIKAVKL